MGQENRRARRYNLSIAVTLVLHDTKHRQVLGTPVRGKLIDISLYGARLSIPHIRTGNSHLFYACNDDPTRVIHLEVLDQEEGDRLVVPAHPVWFDHVLADPASKHFELGVEFLVPPEDPDIKRLHAFIALQPSHSHGSWLGRLLRFVG